jgi:NAD(P)H-hydrate epimerase
MARADAMAVAGGVPGRALMEAAGAAVAEAVRRRWRGGPIVVLAGPGNNGGDGWVAARLLRDAGFRVTLALHGDRERLTGDAAEAAMRFGGAATPATPEALRRAGLIVDALYGSGARLPLAGAAAELVIAANESGAVIVAVDLPSGVEGEGGTTAGPAIRADETVTFFRLKPGHVLLPGRLHCGSLTLAQIGIPPGVLQAIGPQASLNRPALWQPEWRAPDPAGHKHDRGHALVVSGPAGATGAARMAAGAALRIGAGLVTVGAPRGALPEIAGHLTAVMLRPVDGVEGLRAILEDRGFNIVVLGPGLGVGEDTERLAEAALRTGRPVVLDADALTSFAGEPGRLFAAIAQGRGQVVLTPHDGEFARLFPDVEGSRLARARAAASRSGAVVLLKGPDTVVATPEGRAAIADNAPPDLATAGAGDVLAGLVGGLLAQGMPAFEAAAAAVWIHGEAAAAFGAGLTAEDLPQEIPAVLRRLSVEPA